MTISRDCYDGGKRLNSGSCSPLEMSIVGGYAIGCGALRMDTKTTEDKIICVVALTSLGAAVGAAAGACGGPLGPGPGAGIGAAVGFSTAIIKIIISEVKNDCKSK